MKTREDFGRGKTKLSGLFRARNVTTAVILRSGILLLMTGSVWAQKGTGFSLRVVNEIAPAGGIALVRVELTEPKPISKGKIRLAVAETLAPAIHAAAVNPLGSILAVGLLSRSGDVQSVSSIATNAVSVSFSSPNSTFGLDLDLPLMVAAIAVSPDAAPGMTIPLTLDLSNSNFLDNTGQPYVPEVKQGTFTVGGVSITKLAAPVAPSAAGATLTLHGVGFQPGVNVTLENAKVSSLEYINSRQLNLTLSSGFTLDSSSIRLRNPDGSDDVFYALPELRQIGLSGPPKPVFAVASLSLPANSSEDVVVNISPAAQAAGNLSLALSNTGVLAFPTSWPVAVGTSSVMFRVFGRSAGDAVLTATLEGSSTSIPVHVASGSVLQIPVIRNDATLQLGLALTNRGQAPADIRLRGFANDPSSAAAPAVVAAATTITLAPNEQVSRFLGQYDPRFADFKGWVEASSVQPGIRAMFLNLPSDRFEFAGSSDSAGATEFVLPRTPRNASGDFQFVLINNNPTDAAVFLEWWDVGRQVAQANRTIPAQASLSSSLNQLFSGIAGPTGSGFLKVRSAQPLTVYQQGFAGPVLIGSTPAQAAEGSRLLVLPQFASGDGWYTEVSLINLQTLPSDASVTLFDDRGQPLAGPTKISVPAGGQIILQGKDLLGLGGSSLVVGSVRIESQVEILGSAIIGNEGGSYATAAPILPRSFSEAAFAQVANGTLGTIGYFTGLAIDNRNAAPVDVTVETYTAQGRISGQVTVSLPAGGRLSKLLSELIPGLPPQLGGHVHIVSSLPISALEIFGDDSLDFITTVPPAIIR